MESAHYPLPTDLEQLYLSNGLVVIKRQSTPTNIQPSYHRWRDVWDDNKYFRVDNLNRDYLYRAMSISVPQYIVDDTQTTELTHPGYIVGVRDEVGTAGATDIFPIRDIIWV